MHLYASCLFVVSSHGLLNFSEKDTQKFSEGTKQKYTLLGDMNYKFLVSELEVYIARWLVSQKQNPFTSQFLVWLSQLFC